MVMLHRTSLFAAAALGVLAALNTARADEPEVIAMPQSAAPPGAARHYHWDKYVPGESVKPGYVAVQVEDGQILQAPLDYLQPKANYRVHMMVYSGAAGDLAAPVPEAARLLSESTVEFPGWGTAEIHSETARSGYHPDHAMAGVLNGPNPDTLPQKETAMSGSRIWLFSPEQLGRRRTGDAGADAPAANNRREQRWLDAANSVACGDVVLKVYQPGADRIDVSVARYETWHELVYTPGSAFPTLAERRSEAQPQAVTSALLYAAELGYLFDDGTALPGAEEQEKLLAAVKLQLERNAAPAQ
jgi:hypothetical protein